MLLMAPIRKRKRKTLHIGTSTPTVGRPPSAAYLEGYGACRGGIIWLGA